MNVHYGWKRLIEFFFGYQVLEMFEREVHNLVVCWTMRENVNKFFLIEIVITTHLNKTLTFFEIWDGSSNFFGKISRILTNVSICADNTANPAKVIPSSKINFMFLFQPLETRLSFYLLSSKFCIKFFDDSMKICCKLLQKCKWTKSMLLTKF